MYLNNLHIHEQACEWLIYLYEETSYNPEFEQWLNASSMHRVIFIQLSNLWLDLELIPESIYVSNNTRKNDLYTFLKYFK